MFQEKTICSWMLLDTRTSRSCLLSSGTKKRPDLADLRGTLESSYKLKEGTTNKRPIMMGHDAPGTKNATARPRAIPLHPSVTISMIASLLLERYGVNLGDAAFFTIIRAQSTQPPAVMFYKRRALWKSSKLCAMVVIVSDIIFSVSTFT